MKIRPLNALAFFTFILLAPFTWYLIRSWGIPSTKMIFYSLKDQEEIVNIRRALGPIVSWVMVCITLGGTFNFLLMKKYSEVFLYSILAGVGFGVLCFDLTAAWTLARSLFYNIPFQHEDPNIALLLGSFTGFIGGFLGLFQKSSS